MNVEHSEIRVKGRPVRVPSTEIDDRTVVVAGKWLKRASIHEENTIEGDVISDPEQFINRLKQVKLDADVFTFAQSLHETQPKYAYHLEWDNAAAVRISTYDDWLGKRVATDVKQNVKKAGKRGVVVKPVQFDDHLVKGIMEIFNESPVRQGVPFWHYGKDFATVKKETSHCLERSEFIGAYVGEELIGFIKLLYTGTIADIVLIVSKQTHFDKRPTNALIAKSVEVCVERKVSHLTYAKLTYGNKTNSSLAEFKRRHGFEEIRFPRYYIPLTVKGRIAVKLKLHHGTVDFVPDSILQGLRKIRSTFYKRRGVLPDSDKGRPTVQAVPHERKTG